ncbi:unnamed protein product [Calicophoron daubneyi]|uniref:DJ-1/PfpI domain-containing protein n=1 Tax=Calicophoron daubneyi TaxID=300641 RepID=A0AAV2T6N5_CALDB
MSALVFLADGAEELEAVTVIDVLRRGGIDVTVGGVGGPGTVKCSNGVKITPDAALESVASKTFDAVIMPGGLGGSKALCASQLVGSILKKHYDANKIVAAICAAPTALKEHGVGVGKRATCYPGFEKYMQGFQYCQDTVVVDGHLVTSRGPGTAFPFALKLLELLEKDKGTAQRVSQGMLYQKH